MSETDITVFIALFKKNEANHFALQITQNSEKVFENHLLIEEGITGTDIELWLLINCEKVFFEFTPCRSIELKSDHSIQSLKNEALNQSIELVSNTLKKTNEMILQYKQRKKKTDLPQKTLFYNTDSSRLLLSLYQKACELNPDLILYDEMKTSFDINSREFGTPEYMTPTNFIEFVLENNVQQVVSMNNYFLECIFRFHQIHLLAVMKSINTEFVAVDFDTYELADSGYLGRKFFSCNSFRRLSATPSISRPYDRILNIKNIEYVSISQNISSENHLSKIDDNYSFLIFANSRLNDVTPNLHLIFHFLSHVDQNNIFYDFQMLYFALRTVLSSMKLNSIFNFFTADTLISRLHMITLSFLKFEVVHQLEKNSKRKIFLYGDHSWGNVFPNSYQGKYLSKEETSQKLKEKKYLYITFNQNFSYLESNPVHTLALGHNAPFLCFPPVVILENLKGLRHIEYKNPKELIEKSEAINNLTSQKDLLESMKNFSSIMSNSTNDALQAIGLSETKSQTTYSQYCEDAEKKFLKNVQEYIIKHEKTLKSLVKDLLLGGKIDYDIKNSPYFQREYCQRIINSNFEEEHPQ